MCLSMQYSNNADLDSKQVWDCIDFCIAPLVKDMVKVYIEILTPHYLIILLGIGIVIMFSSIYDIYIFILWALSAQ